MGSATSTARPALKRQSHSIAISPALLGAGGEAYFRSESALVPFSADSGRRDKDKKVIRIHSATSLVNLLTGCYEQLSDIPEILETLIQVSFNEDNPTILALDSEFNRYIRMAKTRESMIEWHARFDTYYSPRGMEAFKSQPKKIVDAKELLEALKLGVSGTEKESDFKRITKYYAESTPLCCMLPPTVSLWADIRGHSERLNARGVVPHGISSNGKFLFILCFGGYLQIAPLMNMGCITQMMMHHLGVNFGPEVSVVAKETTLVIMTPKSKYSYEITDLLVGAIRPVITPMQAPQRIYVSDGVSIGKLESDMTFSIIRNGATVRKVKLQAGYSELCKGAPVLLPQAEYQNIPIVMNGAFLAFIFRYSDPQRAIFRVFSTITGQHVGDETFPCPELIYATTFDTLHMCNWAVSLTEAGRLCVRRYNSWGSMDPLIGLLSEKVTMKRNKAFAKMLDSVNTIFLHYYGSRCIPKPYLFESGQDFYDLIKWTIANSKGPYSDPVVVQIAVLLIDWNIRNFKPCEATRELILDLITVLPPNLAVFLFFQSLGTVMFGNTPRAINMLVSLFDQAGDIGMMSFALNKLDGYRMLSTIPFYQPNDFQSLIPEGALPETAVSPARQALLYTHQRHLINSTFGFLRQYKGIQYIEGETTHTFLDHFFMYAKMLFQKLIAVIDSSSSIEEIELSFILRLTFNFLNLSTFISHYHVIAQVLTKLFSEILNRINSMLSTMTWMVATETYFANIVRFFLFTYGKLAATLLQGRSLSDFEKKFIWLISTNLNATDKPDFLSPEVQHFSDPRINDFISSKDNEQMNAIYKVWKSVMNRRLSDELRGIDQLAIVTFAGHMGLLKELLETGAPLSQPMKLCLDQMLRVRNEVRNKIQKGEDYAIIRQRILMLQRMRFAKGVTAKDLGDFVCCDETPEAIVAIIKQQKIRASVTESGFQVMLNALSMKSNQIVIDIFSYALAQIESFECIAATMKINQSLGAADGSVARLAAKILHIIRKKSDGKLILASFRFFRDCDIADIRQHFLRGIVSTFFGDRNDDMGLFALTLSMVKSLNEMPKSVGRNMEQSPMGWLLIAIALENIQADVEFYKHFRKVFWKPERGMERMLARVMFEVINSSNLESKFVKGELQEMVKAIGKCMMKFTERTMVVASEMIWILRRILIEKTRAQPLLLSILETVPKDNEIALAGLFAILGGNLEFVRPYCNIKYHENRSTAQDFIAVPTTTQKNEFICYRRPFVLRDKPEVKQVARGVLVYAVPVLSLSPESFANFDFILSFFDQVFDRLESMTAILYVQTLAHYLTFESFLEKMTPEMIEKLWNCPMPFHEVDDTLKLVSHYQGMKHSPALGKFYSMHYEGMQHMTFVSPQLRAQHSFTVKYEAKLKPGVQNPNVPIAYFGIVSDNVDKHYTRYSLLSIPYGVQYPSGYRVTSVEVPFASEFEVDLGNKVFKWNGQSFEFPCGSEFRVLLAFQHGYDVSLEVSDEDVFDENAVPTIVWRGGTQSLNGEALFRMPDEVRRLSKPPSSIQDFPSWRPLVAPIPSDQKTRLNFIEPPSMISLHIGFSTHASKDLILSVIDGIFKTIALQYSTVCLMRIVKFKPELAKNPFQLFALMVVPLEPFSYSEFAMGRFPFNLRTPVWEESNYLYMSFENDAKDCITSMLKNDKIRAMLTKGIYKASESRSLHLVCYPHPFHRFIPARDENPAVGVISRCAIIAVNCFNPYRSITMENGYRGILPMVVANGPTWRRFGREILKNDRSVFSLSTSDNSFAFDTGFEVLLLLKNLAFTVQSSKERKALKSAFANMFIAQSFVVFHYLSSFATFIGQKLPAIPGDNSKTYKRRVILMGSLVKTGIYSPIFEAFVKQEGRVLGDDSIKRLTRYFPEFSPDPVEEPKSKMCQVPKVSVDPGAISGDIAERISAIVLMSQHYTDLKGFPFWLVLPYWLRISDAWQSDADKGTETVIDPVIEKANDIVHISNPGSGLASIRLKYLRDKRFPQNGMLMVATTPTFENADFVAGREVGKKIELQPRGQLFLSLLDIPGGWEAVHIDVTVDKKKTHAQEMPEEIDIDQIRSEFVSDMYDFAIRWTDDDTEELNLLLPRYALRDPTFATVEAIAAGSSLCQKFPANVVILRALIFHHYNYIRWKFSNKVPPVLLVGTNLLVSCEDALDLISKNIVVAKKEDVATLRIDRHAAQSLVVEGKGNPDHSIIAQMTEAFKKIPLHSLQCKKRPWKVKFKDERAIDAGGPARELLTEAAASIFEPTTELCIPVPNGRRKDGQYKETFIPFNTKGHNIGQYRTIGHFLGIILRTGLAQYLPFAPIVWKYLGCDKIGQEDVLEIDDGLRDQITHLRGEARGSDFSVRIQINWTVVDWDGSVVVLPGHPNNSIVKPGEVEQYIRECIRYRINAIRPLMKEIRTAFRENVGFQKNHPVWSLLSGAILSRMAQGTGVVLCDHLRKITLYVDYEGENDPVIVNFWKAVSRFTPEQMKLLLKFITTLTRLPNLSTNADFHITIDKLNPKSEVDDTLPTASTCFNRLHLPAYTTDEVCYQKLLYAVQFCQTMENK